VLRRQLSISALILVFLGLATLYSLIIPLGEGPDEPGHAAYVFFLARSQRLPVQRVDPQQSDAPGEGHQPPLAYVLAAPLVAWLPPDQRVIDLPGNARFTWAGGAEVNAVAHGSREYPPWSGAVLAWHLARLVSVALGAVTVLCTYKAALALSAAQRASALLAALLVALNPQFLFSSALVTNDALLTALSALLLWLLVGLGARREGSLFQRPAAAAILIGVVLGLALLTKQSALILLPIALLTLAQQRYAELRAADSAAVLRAASVLRAVVLPCLLMLAATLLVAGWWYARNLRLYGDLFGLAAFQAEFATQPFEVGNLAAWRDALAQLHDSFWARFGWMNVPAPGWVIAPIALVELLGLVGLLAASVFDPRSHAKLREEPHSVAAYWPLIALPILAFGWVVSFALTAGLVAWQGRLLFPALPAIAILLARGLTGPSNTMPLQQGVFAPQRHEGHKGPQALCVLCAFVVREHGNSRCNDKPTPTARPLARRSAALLVVGLLLGVIALWLPFGVIQPAYPFHTIPEQTALARLGTPVYGRFKRAGERGAELRGWRLEGPAQVHTTPSLVLMWHARGRQNRDWVVFIHLVDAHGQIVAEDNRPPQDGVFPMTQWVADDWVEDRHPLQLPPTLAPGSYSLRVGLYDPSNNRRTGVYDTHGDLRGDYLTLGSITVTSK
jgi:hypothetical protein